MASNEISIDELLEGLGEGNGNNIRSDNNSAGDRLDNLDGGFSNGRLEQPNGRQSGSDEETGREVQGEVDGNNTTVDNRSTTTSPGVQSISDLVGDTDVEQEDGTDTNGEQRSKVEDKGLSEPRRESTKDTEQALPDLPKGITEEIIDRVVSSAWLSHMLDGSVNVDNIKENLPKNVALPKGWTVGKVLLLPHVAKKLEARGVPKPSEANILTPKQIQALTVITSARGSKWQTRLKQAGVTIAEWNSWLKQPNFRMVFDRYAEGRLKDAIPEGITALTDKAADGDLNSIKLVLEMTGRHNPNAEKDINIQAILVGIVEILQQEIHDGEALMRIVNRIKGLQTGIGIGSGHIKGEIE